MSKIDNLRSFLTVLENAGQLVHIERSVDLEYELADVAAALERRRGPASLFKNVSSSKQSPEPVGGWPIFASAVAVPGAQGHEMDPTADARGVHTKVGVDATFDKSRRDYAGRVRYLDVDLSKYL